MPTPPKKGPSSDKNPRIPGRSPRHDDRSAAIVGELTDVAQAFQGGSGGLDHHASGASVHDDQASRADAAGRVVQVDHDTFMNEELFQTLALHRIEAAIDELASGM
jgi:hypothetical protein